MKRQNFQDQYELILPAGQIRLLLPPGITADSNDLAKESRTSSNNVDDIG